MTKPNEDPLVKLNIEVEASIKDQLHELANIGRLSMSAVARLVLKVGMDEAKKRLEALAA